MAAGRLPVQLHPGDLGWAWRFGAVTLAEALRVWTVDATAVAIGFLDEAALIRMAIAPPADHDEELAQALVRDLEDPMRGVLDADKVSVEARFGTAFRSLLRSRGWVDGDPWAPLVRDLSDPVEGTALRVEVVGPERVDDRVAVQRAAFLRSTFTAERWHEMSRSPAYQQARCLVGYDSRTTRSRRHGVVGRVGPARTVGAGGRPPRPSRSRYGTAISLAAAAALRDLGSSSALVATSSSNEAARRHLRVGGFPPHARRHRLRLPPLIDGRKG